MGRELEALYGLALTNFLRSAALWGPACFYSGRRSTILCQSAGSVALAINSRSSTICPIVNRIGWP